MANIKRHFNFAKTMPQEQETHFSSGKPSGRHFDKNSLMNDICNSLDLCCAYIQALNSLCCAGSSLAKNLFHTFRDIPAYYNVSLQFASIWEEISKATAGASAAVKTETLMMLQEILNSLETSVEENNAENVIINSFQVIGSCLCSFIELQSQFSFSTWKSFSKLSKHFISDSSRHALQWKSFERNTPKLSVNTDLNSTIKKHFSHFLKIGITKMNETSQAGYNTYNSSTITNVSKFPFLNIENMQENVSATSMWTNQIWDSPEVDAVKFSKLVKAPPTECQNSSMIGSGLDEVINLLSCVPVQHSSKMNDQNQNYFKSSDQMYHLLPKVAIPSSEECTGSHQSWAKDRRDIPIGYNSWIWRVDQMNSSALPLEKDISKAKHNNALQWENRDLQKWNSLCDTGSSSDDGSSVHGPDMDYFLNGMNGSFVKSPLPISNRKQAYVESMPGGLENISESKEEGQWTLQTKISTWPLKQSSFKNSEDETQEPSDYTSCHHNSFLSS